MGKKKFFKEYLEPILVALLIALLIRAFVVQAFKIPSGSMEPTLLVGDYLLVNKFIYGLRIPYTNIKVFQYKKPQRGDIIVFIYPKDPTKDFIKRVIGTEGEKVQLLRNQIYINDRLIDDPWGHFQISQQLGSFPMMGNFGPVVVPHHALFVLGDNRDNSQDSRFWGYVDLNAVLGKALIIYFSWNGNDENPLDKVRWSRIGKLIH
jgi:signal peptidase I